MTEARDRYLKNPDGELIHYLSTLYSFVVIPGCTEKLLELRRIFVERAWSILENRRQASTDDMDVLATVLVWLSRRKELGNAAERSVRHLALNLCLLGMDRAAFEPSGGHTWCLLTLTHAALLTAQGTPNAALRDLDTIWPRALAIKDANQKARVYRKLGMLYRKHSRYLPGFGWGIRAIFVRDTPIAVRAKSVFALIPFIN